MKLKQIMALLLACVMVFSMAACGDTTDETTTASSTTESTADTTTSGSESTSGTTIGGTDPITPGVLETQAVAGAQPVVIPLGDAKNAVTVAGIPAVETREIPLIVVLVNFDANGNGVDDWDPENPGARTSGEQWATTSVEDHYDAYFGGEWSLSSYFYEASMGAFRYVAAEIDNPPEGAKYNKGIIEVTVPIKHPSCSGDAQGAISVAFEATDPYIDYRKFDTNNDGYIVPTELGVVLLNPGTDKAYGTTDMGGVHPYQVHGTSQSLNAFMEDGDIIFSGSVGSKVTNIGEYGKAGAPMKMGTAAHELAHNLGAEDLYDTKRNGHGGAAVSGWPRAYNFSLQCNGNHLADGARPSYEDPYHRIYLGWADCEVVEDGVYTIYSTKTQKYKVLRVNTPDPGEYYLIEIRLKEGFESNLTGGTSKGGIMVWHIDEDLCDRFFVEGSASTSHVLNGNRHDPAIVPLFREGYDEEGRYMKQTSPQDPFYYYDPADPSKAVFDSGNFRSVTNGTQSLNSYPDTWEGSQNYNLHIEVLSEPGQEMTIKITSGTKDYTPKVIAGFASKTHNSLTLQGTLAMLGDAEITGCAVAVSTSEDFTENYKAVNATMSEDGKSFIGTIEGLEPETRYYYKVYFTSNRGYGEATGDTTTSLAPQEKTNCTVSLYSDAGARAYAVKAAYGKALEIPSGWLKSIANKKKGYELEGWYYDAEFTKPYDMNKVVEKGTEDFELYAKWVPAS